MVRGHSLVRRAQRRKASAGRQHRQDHLPSPRRRGPPVFGCGFTRTVDGAAAGRIDRRGAGVLLGVGGARRAGRFGSLAHRGQDIAEHLQQPLGLGAMLLAQRLQPGPALLVDDRHALAEHLGHLVPSGGAQHVDEAGQQREPLLLADLDEIRDVGDPRLASEVRDLARRNPLQPCAGRPERVQVGKVRQAGLELADRRGPRRVLEPVEPAAPTGRVHHQQLGQPRVLPRSDPPSDCGEHVPVHLSADLGRHSVQRGISGQLPTRFQQLLQRHVDQVGRVVLRGRCRSDRRLSDAAHIRRVVLHPQALAHVVAIPRS